MKNSGLRFGEVPRTMILVDSDLDPDADSPASVTKRASPTRPGPIDSSGRLPSARALGRFLRQAQGAVRLRGQVSVLLTTDGKIRRMNRQFRGKNAATDVLSFPAPEMAAGEVAGDLAISVDTARRQSGDQGHSLSIEIKVLMLHGLLHLAGYDHEHDDGAMARREQLLRRRLGLPQGLIERSGDPALGARRGLRRRISNAGPSTARITGVIRSAQDNKPKKKRVLRSAQDDGQVRGRKP